MAIITVVHYTEPDGNTKIMTTWWELNPHRTPFFKESYRRVERWPMGYYRGMPAR